MNDSRSPAAEEFPDALFDAFAPDDEDRIAGLSMRFEPLNPPMYIRRVWELDAECDPLPAGVD